MSTGTRSNRVAPGVVKSDVAARALSRVKSFLASDQANQEEIDILVEAGVNEALVVPRPAVEMFAFILSAMANGQGVQLMPVNAELTTQQAADMMNVSRPYLIKLIENGEIEHRLVGRHRRIRYDALVDYMRRDDLARKQAADELSRMDEELEGD